MVDEGKQRAVVVQKTGFPDAVVWNPWIDKAAGMADFGDEEYKVGKYAMIRCTLLICAPNARAATYFSLNTHMQSCHCPRCLTSLQLCVTRVCCA